MKNFVQKGDTVTIPSPGNIDSGDAVYISAGLVGVAAGDASTGEPLDLVTRGVFELAKVEATAIDIGEPIYLVAGVAGGLVTDDPDGSTNKLIGVAVTAAPNPSASVHVKIG